MMTVAEWKKIFANNTIDSVNYKNTALEKVTCNGTIVWESLKSVTISGTAKSGQTLTATITPSTANVTYQWCRNGSNISGATNKTYTLTNSDVGTSITCKASTSTKTVTSNTISGIDYNWVYSSTPIVVANQSSQGGTNDYTMQGKKPVQIHHRWWWAGDDGGTYYPTGYHKFTFHYKDGTSLTYTTTSTNRDVDCTDTLPSEYQKELDYFDWELITTVGSGIVRTTGSGYPRFEAYYYHD